MISKILFIFVNLLFITCAYANNVEPEFFVCPAQIQCDTTGLCILDEKDKKYTGPFFAPVGTYNFSGAVAPFHSTWNAGYCVYIKLDNTGYPQRLNLNPESALEAYYLGEKSEWNILTNQENFCTSTNPSLCPLKKSNSIIIRNVNITNGIEVKANGIYINKTMSANSYIKITDEDALLACGNVPKCNLDIQSGKSFKYGSISIDTDKMKVLGIVNGFKSVNIKKVAPFDAIEVSYLSLLQKITNLYAGENFLEEYY